MILLRIGQLRVAVLAHTNRVLPVLLLPIVMQLKRYGVALGTNDAFRIAVAKPLLGFATPSFGVGIRLLPFGIGLRAFHRGLLSWVQTTMR
jgi:hypothetical protein